LIAHASAARTLASQTAVEFRRLCVDRIIADGFGSPVLIWLGLVSHRPAAPWPTQHRPRLPARLINL
jgi:hypothetical protein